MDSSHYIEVQPERDVSGANFSKGMINFNWTFDSSAYFNPHKSFMKIRCKLTNPDGNLLTQAEEIAPNMFLPSHLFQQLKMHINNVCVSEISDYVPQVTALKERMYASEDRHKNYLADLCMSDAYFQERQSKVVDGITVTNAVLANNVTSNQIYSVNNLRSSRGVYEFEIIWHLPLSFFSVDEYVPGCQGLFNLQLTPQPQSVYQRLAIETSNDNGKTPTTNYLFEITTMQLYLLKGIGQPVTSSTLKLKLKEIRCQSQNLTTSNLHQKTFQVHPRTSELTLAYQNADVLTNNRWSQAKYRCYGDDERKLVRFWIDFGGKQLPTPIADMKYAASESDFWTQRYVESLMYANAVYVPEPYDKWFERGPYLHFSGYGVQEKDDRVYVSQQFSEDFNANGNPNVLLFDHYIKNVVISIEGSRIRNVSAI